MATSRQQPASRARKAPQASRPTSAPSSRSRSTPRTNGGSARSGSRARATSANRASKPTATRSAPREAKDTGGSTISKIAKPAMAGGAAVAAIVGGAVLGAKALPRKRRFPANLGHQLNGLAKSVDMKKARKQIEGLDIKKTRKQIGKASKQFGELTREIRKAGEQAERIGDALS